MLVTDNNNRNRDDDSFVCLSVNLEWKLFICEIYYNFGAAEVSVYSKCLRTTETNLI